tara:strand:- start:686 stop:910 length:225 start_codon:yes stop_codon:yes gene_type:complete
LFFSLLSTLSIGYYLKSENDPIGNKLIGFTVLFFVFIFLPIFIYQGWKNKKIEDYILSDEKLKKIKTKSSKSSK